MCARLTAIVVPAFARFDPGELRRASPRSLGRRSASEGGQARLGFEGLQNLPTSCSHPVAARGQTRVRPHSGPALPPTALPPTVSIPADRCANANIRGGYFFGRDAGGTILFRR